MYKVCGEARNRNSIIERLEEKEKKKSYKLTIKAFKAFVKAETLLEKQNAEVLKELAKGKTHERKTRIQGGRNRSDKNT